MGAGRTELEFQESSQGQHTAPASAESNPKPSAVEALTVLQSEVDAMATESGMSLSAKERQSMASDVDDLVHQEKQQPGDPRWQLQRWAADARQEHRRELTECLGNLVDLVESRAGQAAPPLLGPVQLSLSFQRRIIITLYVFEYMCTRLVRCYVPISC